MTNIEICRRLYKRRKANNVCVRCRQPKTVSTVMCTTCRVERKKYYRDRAGKQRKQPDKVAQAYRTGKLKRDRIRTEVLNHYGSKCACCGETTPEFLEIDHVNNDGKEHRKKHKIQWIYGWLVRNNFPSDPEFQLLCSNCNRAKSHHGICPHKNLDRTIPGRASWWSLPA